MAEGNLVELETERVVPEDNSVLEEAEISTVSISKINVETDSHDNEDKVTGYRMIDTEILNYIFQLLACPECFLTDTIELTDLLQKKKGLASCLSLKCSSCGFSHRFYPSKSIDTGKSGMKVFDIYVRTICGMRAVGGGHWKDFAGIPICQSQ